MGDIERIGQIVDGALKASGHPKAGFVVSVFPVATGDLVVVDPPVFCSNLPNRQAVAAALLEQAAAIEALDPE